MLRYEFDYEATINHIVSDLNFCDINIKLITLPSW